MRAKISTDAWVKDARRQGMREDMITEMIETIAAGFAEPCQVGDEIGLQITPLGESLLAKERA